MLRGAHEWRYPLQETPFQKHSMARNAAILFRLMASGRLRMEPLITQILPPEEAAATFAGLRSHPEDYTGVVFDWTRPSEQAQK